MHSIAKMADVLRADPGAHGVVSGVGMHMTKHVFGVYSTTPGQLAPADEAAVQRDLDAQPATTRRTRARRVRRPSPRTRSCTAGTVRPSGPSSCATRMALGRTRGSSDPEQGREAETDELVGAPVRLAPRTVAGPMGDARVNVATPVR